MPLIVDTHCHLGAEEFANDLDAVVARAKEVGVEKMLVVGTDFSNSKKSLEVASRFPSFRASAGIHPHDASEYLETPKWEEFEQLAKSHPFCAIGETGLDYYYNHSPREAQREVFARQIRLSKSLKLPLILHCRDAYEEMTEILDQEAGAFGIVHCFTGNSAQAKSFLNRGFYISFSGIVTFPKAVELQAACKTVPIDRLLVETDAPFLAPVPHRGKRNEPAFVVDTLKKIAALRMESWELLAEKTTSNAEKILKL